MKLFGRPFPTFAIALLCISIGSGPAPAQNTGVDATKATPSVRSREGATRGFSINSVPDDEQCKRLLARAEAVSILRQSRDYGYCVKRQQSGGK